LTEERRLRVFENRVLRKTFGPKRDEITGEWRKLRNEELNDLYFLYVIVQVIRSRKMRWAWHVARIGERRGVYRVMVGNLKEKAQLEDLDGRIILRWSFRKWDVASWTGSVCLRIGTGGGHL
jgi:hypothetical protein